MKKDDLNLKVFEASKGGKIDDNIEIKDSKNIVKRDYAIFKYFIS